jgi:hypothetical protein
VVVVYPYNEDYYINPSTFNVQASLPATQHYLANSYGLDGNIMISQSEYNQIALKSVCGWLKVQLTGNGEKVKSITLNGNNGEQVAGQIYINSADATCTLAAEDGLSGDDSIAGGNLVFDDTIFTSVTLNCGEGVTLGSEPTAFYIALPPQTFENGFTVEIEAMDGSIMTKSTDKTLTIERNHIQPMATFELPQKPIDLAMNGTANCYIISSAGNYVFPAVQGNSSIFIESISSVEILWESFGDAKTPNIGDLIKSVSYRNGYVELSTSDKYTEGNAVVAVKKDDGTILWSWHIWLTDYPDEQLYYNNTKGMMDRNLDATSDIRVDIHSLGLFYQWGRKDPFLGPGKISSVQKAASTYHWPTPEESTKETGTIEYTISHPTTFITGNRFNNDWYFTGSKSSDSSRWSYKKTIYDPCPAGWKLPSMSVWTNVWGVNTEDNGYDAYYNDAILAHWVGGDYGGKTFGLNLKTMSEIEIPRLASGGIVENEGQLFIAREAGPELVGTIGNKSAVVNNDQIISGIEAGVYRAMMAANSTNQGGSQTIRIINEIDGDVVGEKVIEYHNGRVMQTGVSPLLV